MSSTLDLEVLSLVEESVEPVRPTAENATKAGLVPVMMVSAIGVIRSYKDKQTALPA